jgi:undecaprenyl-diphosphatase
LRISQAAALGALHGPAELLPISSSGHMSLVPWLLGWSYAELDDGLRKSFEVALHAGTAAALLIVLRAEVGDSVRRLDRRRLSVIALSSIPPAIVGYSLERPIEQRLGTPAATAAGLIVGAAVIRWADRAPQTRHFDQAGARDAIWLGIAQACALIPGVSRNGATLAAARLRGFAREDASRLSRHVALPVIAGAGVLKGTRLRRRGLPPGTAAGFVVGAGAAFASTLGSTRLIRRIERGRSLLPYAIYRAAIAAIVLARLAESGASRTITR